MSRRRAREMAMSIVFQLDQGTSDLQEAVDFLQEENPLSGPALEYAITLAKGAWENRQQIDTAIQECSIEWKVSRMAAVDRNILRIAVYELKYVEEVPVQVVIDEAVELAKQYGSSDSSRFINGVLGAMVNVQPSEVDTRD